MCGWGGGTGLTVPSVLPQGPSGAGGSDSEGGSPWHIRAFLHVRWGVTEGVPRDGHDHPPTGEIGGLRAGLGLEAGLREEVGGASGGAERRPGR